MNENYYYRAHRCSATRVPRLLGFTDGLKFHLRIMLSSHVEVKQQLQPTYSPNFHFVVTFYLNIIALLKFIRLHDEYICFHGPQVSFPTWW